MAIIIIAILALLLFNGSLVPASEWDFFSAGIITILGFFIVGFFLPFASPDLWQRVYSAKGKREVKLGLLWSIVPYAIVAFLLALIALTVKVKFPSVEPDLALIHGFANLLPPGLVGLSVVLLFGAIMSSLDTYLYTAASAIIQDFSKSDSEKTVRNIKKTIFILSILAVIIAILIQSLIVGTFIFVALVMVLSVTVILTWIKKNVKERTLVFGFVIGLFVSIGFMVFSALRGSLQPTVIIVSLIAGVLGLIIGGLVSLVKR